MEKQPAVALCLEGGKEARISAVHRLPAPQRCRIAELELPVQKSQRERGCKQEVSR